MSWSREDTYDVYDIYNDEDINVWQHDLYEITVGHLIFYIAYMKENHPEKFERIEEAEEVLRNRLGDAEINI
jgi:hypothetical protein